MHIAAVDMLFDDGIATEFKSNAAALNAEYSDIS